MICLSILQAVALVGGTVHDMSGAPAGPGTVPARTPDLPGEAPGGFPADILIVDGVIRALGPDLALPPGTSVIDVRGQHLVPGLIDGLAHFDRDMDPLYVDAGVTFLRDLGGDMSRLLAERLPAVRDEAPGPALMVCGAVLDGPQPATTEAVILASPMDVEAKLPRMRELGVDFLSFHLGLDRTVWTATLAKAGELGLDLWGPLPAGVPLADVAASSQAGLLYLDAFLHPGEQWDSVDPALVEERAASLAGQGLAVAPVIGLIGRLRADPGPQAPILDLLAPHYAWAWEQERLRAVPSAAATDRALAAQLRLLAALHGAGIPLVPGSGSPHPWLLPGEGLLTELLLWQRAGIPAWEVLRHATSGAARVLGLEGRGGLVVGQVADILVLEEDPTLDLVALADPVWVVLRGRPLDREERARALDDLADEQTRQRLALAEPLDVPDPEIPEGDPVLAGRIETVGFGTRLSAESFTVVRTLDGGLAWCGHILTPASIHYDERNLDLVQHTRAGRLVGFELTLETGGHVYTVSGKKLGTIFSVERRVDGLFLDNTAAREPIAFVDAGSITASMLLARRSPGIPIYALTFDDTNPVISRWQVRFEENGRLIAATDQGGLTAGFSADGLPAFSARVQGNDLIESRVLEATAFGGAGVPLAVERVWEGASGAEEAAGSDSVDGGPAGEAADPGPEGAAGGSLLDARDDGQGN